MGILDRYARKPREEIRDKTVTTKLTGSEYERFQEYCAARGLAVSEAVRLLILAEMDEAPTVQAVAGRVRQTGGTRWTMAPYLNPDGVTFRCPICGENIHRSNGARHARTHGYPGTRELLEGGKRDDE